MGGLGGREGRQPVGSKNEEEDVTTTTTLITVTTASCRTAWFRFCVSVAGEPRGDFLLGGKLCARRRGGRSPWGLRPQLSGRPAVPPLPTLELVQNPWIGSGPTLFLSFSPCSLAVGIPPPPPHTHTPTVLEASVVWSSVFCIPALSLHALNVSATGERV